MNTRCETTQVDSTMGSALRKDKPRVWLAELTNILSFKRVQMGDPLDRYLGSFLLYSSPRFKTLCYRQIKYFENENTVGTTHFLYALDIKRGENDGR